LKKKVLIIAAHPDDEILGCGGTAARLVRENKKVFTAILGEGVTSRQDKRDREKSKAALYRLKEQIIRANKIIGIEDLFIHDFPDNRFDTVPLLEIVKVVEDLIIQIEPDIIFTHFGNDLNVDHRLTYQAVLTAVRPMSGKTVREIYSFEILSSTEWNFPSNFCPEIFYDIEKTMDLKLDAIREYQQELRDFPHPRSLKGIEVNAMGWGMKAGVKYAEAFKAVRILK
jgi:LmbE family N-acetylglucosaminyl deacetylase